MLSKENIGSVPVHTFSETNHSSAIKLDRKDKEKIYILFENLNPKIQSILWTILTGKTALGQENWKFPADFPLS